jgi:hypothetical protein
MKIIIPNPPEGYEQEAEYKAPSTGEHFIDSWNKSKVVIANSIWTKDRIVLTPKKPKIKWMEARFLKVKNNGDYLKATISYYPKAKDKPYFIRDWGRFTYEGMCEMFEPCDSVPEE